MTIYTVREDGWENSQFLLWLCHLNCLLIKYEYIRLNNEKCTLHVMQYFGFKKLEPLLRKGMYKKK